MLKRIFAILLFTVIANADNKAFTVSCQGSNSTFKAAGVGLVDTAQFDYLGETLVLDILKYNDQEMASVEDLANGVFTFSAFKNAGTLNAKVLFFWAIPSTVKKERSGSYTFSAVALARGFDSQERSSESPKLDLTCEVQGK